MVMEHQRNMLIMNLFHILIMTQATVIPDCLFDGAFPNDTVHCKGFKQHRLCTNSRECCKIPRMGGCYNMSVIEAYGLWTPPPSQAIPAKPDGNLSCSRHDLFTAQGNNSNKAIDGHVIAQHKVVTVTQCSDFCLRQPRCRGFNLATVLDPEGRKLCDLLGEKGNIVHRQGFNFWFFDRASYEEAYLLPVCPLKKKTYRSGM